MLNLLFKNPLSFLIFAAILLTVIAVHEFAHAFAKLRDEYTYEFSPVTGEKAGWALRRNCSIVPTFDFAVNDRAYGGKFEGCTYDSVIGYDGRIIPIYRSSDNSIMNSHSTNRQFNVISCGFILANIKGGYGKSHFPECAAMPSGIIPFGEWE